MPRVSRQQSALNRAAITEVSARLMRERGVKGVSVADLMDAAGLTHGGFYGHFESKDALAAAACASAFAVSAQRWSKRTRTAIVDGFLSIKSRNAPGAACPTATLAGDVAREPADAPIRAEFAAGLEQLLQILSTLQAGSAAEQRQNAAADLAALVGAQVLARATSHSAMSEELLAAVRARLLGRKAGA
jgi:TetR/AcrR family transcriptional regulator, transcriptional repressor for nem operon